MERQANQETIIQREIMKTIFENGEQVGLMFLVVVLTMSQFEAALNCLLEEFSFRLSHHRSNPGDIRELLAVKLLVLICSCCIVLFSSVATISSSSSSGVKVISLKDMAWKSNMSWKRLFVTSCYLSLVGVLYCYVSVFLQ